MKLFGYNITVNRAKEQFKAGLALSGSSKPERQVFSIGEHSWRERCRHFSELWNNQPLFKQGVLTLAGMVTAQGVFTTPALDKDGKTYPQAEEAQFRVDQFNKSQYVNTKFYDTVVGIGKFGGCFWEISNDPFSFRIPPQQEYIEPAEVDELGNVTWWRQVNASGGEVARWRDGEELVLVPFNVTTDTWPYGTSLGAGLETELTTLIDMVESAKDFMEKQAWPYEILSVGDRDNPVLDDDFSNARSEWMHRKPGQGIVTSVPTAIIAGGTGSSPIRDTSALCGFIKDNLHDGLMMPPLSKLFNSTEASAKVMTQHAMTVLGLPIQWVIKEAYQTHILKPYLENSGFSVKSCPEILFESPDTNKVAEGQYWTQLVNAKIQSPHQACIHLGLEYDEAYWTEQEKKQEEQFQMKAQMAKANGDSAPNDANPKEDKVKPEVKEKWIVERIRQPHTHHADHTESS